MPRTSSAGEPRVAVSSLCADSCGLLMASRMVVGSWPQCDSLNSLSCNVIHRQRRSVQSLLPQTQHLLPCTEYAEDEASCPMARQCRDLANRCTARGPGGVALGVLVFRATAADSFQRNIVHIRVEPRYGTSVYQPARRHQHRPHRMMSLAASASVRPRKVGGARCSREPLVDARAVAPTISTCGLRSPAPGRACPTHTAA